MGWLRVRCLWEPVRHSVGAPKWAAAPGARTPAARCEICGREQFLDARNDHLARWPPAI